MEKIRSTKILAIVGIACLILGIFFPYVNIKIWSLTQSVALTHYWEGYVIVLVAIANGIMIFREFVEKYIPKLFIGKFGEFLTKVNNPKATLIPTGIAALLVIYLNTAVHISSYVKYGLGFYIIVIGIVALAAYPFVYKEEK